MSAWLETWAVSALLCGLCVLGLAAMRDAPPRLRFYVAAAGLAAWLVPWAWIDISFDSSVALEHVVPALAGGEPTLRAVKAAAEAPGLERALTFAAWTAAALTALGLLLFARDCLRVRGTLRKWRSDSRCGEALRALLPAELRKTRAAIRVVPGSRTAAASGCLSPTIWVGELLEDERLRIALAHESWHVRSAAPLLLMLIAAVRRVYWWNPLVTKLASHAVLMMEAACDRRCARVLGRPRYAAGLAGIMLEATSRRRACCPRSAAAATTFCGSSFCEGACGSGGERASRWRW